MRVTSSLAWRVVHEPLLRGIELQRHAELHVVLGDVHAVGIQVAGHAVERFGQALVVREGFLDFARRLPRAEPVGDVAGVDQAGREVAFQNLRVQLLGVAAADGGDPVAVMAAGFG